MKFNKYKIVFIFIISFNHSIFSQDYWQRLNSPSIIEIRSLITNSKNDIFVTIWNKGIFRSKDSGNSWEKILDISYGCVTIDNNDVLYAIKDYRSDTLLISKDNGSNWGFKMLPDTVDGIFSTANGYIYVFSQEWSLLSDNQITYQHSPKIFFSIDGSETWQKLNIPIKSFFWSKPFQIVNGNILIIKSLENIGENYECYYSLDWGITWTNFIEPVYQSEFEMISDTILIASNNSFSFSSSDFGKTWKKLNQSGQSFVNPYTSELYIKSGRNMLWSSSDRGISWNIISDKLPTCWDFYFTKNNMIFTNCLHRSLDSCKTWSPLAGNILTSAIYSIAIDDKNNLFVETGSEVYRSDNNGKCWQYITRYNYGNIYVDNNNNIYQIAPGELLKSMDNGKTWENVFLVYNQRIKKIWFDSNNNIFMLFENGGLKYSTNDGISWKNIISFDPNAFMRINDFVVNSNNHIFLSINDPDYNGIFRSFDFGATQFAQTSLTSSQVDQLAINSENKIFVLLRSQWENGQYGYAKVFSSVDEGNTWINNSDNLQISTYNEIVFEMDKKNRLFFSSGKDGIAFLDSNKNYWVTLNSGLPTKLDAGKVIYPDVLCMTFDNDGNIFIGTSEGIFKGGKDIYIGVEKETNDTPKQFFLYQNYPNPFNPITTIKYSIPSNLKGEMAKVSLKVYDVLGKEVATLVNEEKPAGSYEVMFDAFCLPSGIYFYKLQTGSYTETKKLILMK